MNAPDPSRDDHQDRELRPDEQCDRAVLMFMLDEPGGPWSINEIAGVIENRNDAIDATRRLVQAGLIHRVGDFFFPTLAARHTDKITGSL